MKIMPSIITQHNVKTLSAESNKNRSCNCRNKECCPLEGYMKLKFQQKTILNYIMVHAKENLNLVFITKRNHFEIEVMKQSFQSNLATEGRIQKITTYVGKDLCM